MIPVYRDSDKKRCEKFCQLVLPWSFKSQVHTNLYDMMFKTLALSLFPSSILYVKPCDHVTGPTSHEPVEQLQCYSGSVPKLCKRRWQSQ